MPQSLQYDAVASKARQGLIAPLGSVLLTVTLVLGFGLLAAWRSGRWLMALPPVAFQILPWAVVILPLLTGFFGFVKPACYRVLPDETVIARRIWLSSFGFSWWTLGLLLPALVVGLGVLIAWAARNSGNLALSFGDLLGSFALAFGLAIFYSSMLFLESETRVDDEGIRLGTNHFLEWENVARVQKIGEFYEVFHLQMPSFPATAFRPLGPQEDEI